MRIDGSTALVTGATGGIGAAVARSLHDRGASLVLSGRRVDALSALADDLPGTTAVPCDLAHAGERDQLAERAAEVDILVLVAGVSALGRLESFSVDEIERSVGVNLLAPVLLARAAAPAMVARGRGHIVFVSSINGRLPAPRMPVYAGTKFALRGLAASLRQDLAGTGVGVSTILPGPVADAGMWADAGLRPPRSAGPRLAADVARGVIRAIEHDRAEVHVASVGLRATAALADIAPDTTAALLRRTGSVPLGEAMATAFPRRI
jgi:short-subunit dehydrogenase